jgi:putative restriction endonuclease
LPFHLDKNETLLLEKSREADASYKPEVAVARVQTEMGKLLAAAEQRLNEAGAFDPGGVVDARERVLSSIVRRRGQPAFRQRLLAAYHGQCAITGCGVAAVLDAAHIVSYKGPDTNRPANGLLLRTDLHTLFDLRLVAVDVETMTLLVSPELSGTCYEEYHGRPITVPDNGECRPSSEALEQHREESGL